MMRTAWIALVVLLASATTTAHADGSASLSDVLDTSMFNVGSGDRSLGNRTSEWLDRGIEGWNQTNELGSSVSSGLDQLNALREMFSALSDMDQELDSRMTGDDGAGPEVPSSCPGGEACNECFTRAYGEINFTRNTLERLRTIHRRTIAFIERAEGFGDSVSGVHGISGLSWQYAKADVEASRAEFNRNSRNKYEALLQNMRRALDMVAQCEAKHYNNPDWYNRFGFMYYNFVREAYSVGE